MASFEAEAVVRSGVEKTVSACNIKLLKMKAHIETMRTKNQVRCEADIFKLLGLRRYYPPHDRNDRLGMCMGVGRLVMCVLGRGG